MCLFHKKYLGDKHRTPGDWEIWRTLSLITSELQVCKQTSKATPKKLWTYCNLCTSFLFWKDFRRKQIAQPPATKNHFLCFSCTTACPKIQQTNAMSFYRSQNVLCCSNFFVPDQKFIYILWQSQTFCTRQNDNSRLQNASWLIYALSFYRFQNVLCRSKFFEPAQKFDCI